MPKPRLSAGMREFSPPLDRNHPLLSPFVVAQLTRIEVVHNHNIIFRDTKPENFLVGRKEKNDQNRIYMIDFGLVCSIPAAFEVSLAQIS